jgi:acyl-coenzyme A synthetase/AMP-(fatty) acid ligase
LEWYTKHIPIPAIDHWWQTESGWPMIATMMGVEIFYQTQKLCWKGGYN